MAEIKTKEGDVVGHYHDANQDEIDNIVAGFRNQVTRIVKDKGWEHVKGRFVEGPLKPQSRRMTKARLFTFARTTMEECIQLAERKNADYTGHSDPFKNLRRGGPYGIAVRLDDKVSRLLTLTSPTADAPTTSESVHDTLMDIVNYGWLLMALLEEAGDASS